jgi:hypothetical protein
MIIIVESEEAQLAPIGTIERNLSIKVGEAVRQTSAIDVAVKQLG